MLVLDFATQSDYNQFMALLRDGLELAAAWEDHDQAELESYVTAMGGEPLLLPPPYPDAPPGYVPADDSIHPPSAPLQLYR